MAERHQPDGSRSQRRQRRDPPDEVRVLGRRYPVIGDVRVRGRTYWLLERLSTIQRERYLGFDPGFGRHGRPVAVVILPESQASRQHLQSLSRVSIDALPVILDFDVQRDRTVVVLDWVHGPTLTKYLRDMVEGRARRISPTVALHRIRGLAHGLSHWHRRLQVVHGDIKPDNIVISHSGRLVLIDFGSAWTTEATAARSEGDGSDPIYAAPELQFGGGRVDFRSDQFSLSVILYQLLTLQIPWGQLGGRAGRPESMLREIPQLIPPSDLWSASGPIPRTIRDAINRVTMRGLALDPDNRYPTPQAWLDDLEVVHNDINRNTDFPPFLDRLTGVVTSLVNPFRKD